MDMTLSPKRSLLLSRLRWPFLGLRVPSKEIGSTLLTRRHFSTWKSSISSIDGFGWTGERRQKIRAYFVHSAIESRVLAVFFFRCAREAKKRERERAGFSIVPAGHPFYTFFHTYQLTVVSVDLVGWKIKKIKFQIFTTARSNETRRRVYHRQALQSRHHRHHHNHPSTPILLAYPAPHRPLI